MLPLFSSSLFPSLLAFLSFSQGFGCKTASHFVEFLCRINICNCKALGGTSPCFKGRGEVMGGSSQLQHPGSTKANRVGLVPSTDRNKWLLEITFVPGATLSSRILHLDSVDPLQAEGKLAGKEEPYSHLSTASTQGRTQDTSKHFQL